MIWKEKKKMRKEIFDKIFDFFFEIPISHL